MSTNIKIALLIVIWVGLFLRLYRVGSNPVSLYWDEAAMAYDAYSVSQTGLDMQGNHWIQAIYPSYGDFKLPMYIWLTSVFMKLLGPTELSVRLTSVIAGTLLIGIVYLLGSHLFKSKTAGLFSAGVLAFSPWAIQFSRAGFEANLGLFWMTLAILCLVWSLKKPWLLSLVAASAAAGVYSYFSVRFVVPIVAILYILLNIRSVDKKFIIWFLAASIIFAALLIPIYRSPNYAQSNQFRLSTPSLLNTNEQVIQQNVNRELAGNTLVSRLIYHRDWFLLKRLAVNLATNMDLRYLFFSGDPNLRHGTGQTGLMLLPLGLFFFTGWITMFKRYWRQAIFLLGWWLAAIIPASIPLTLPHALRSLNALPVLALVIGYGVTVMWQSRFRWAKIIATGVLLLSLLSFSLYWHDYWQHYPERSAEAWQYGYEQLAGYLNTASQSYQAIYIVPADRLYLYLLFFMKIPPQMNMQKASNIQMKAVDEKTFRQLPTKSLVVLDLSLYNDYQQKIIPKAILNDFEGKPQFIVLEK